MDEVCEALEGQALDGLIYTVATWEASPDLTKLNSARVNEILAVNVGAFIALVRGLIGPLALAGNARVVAIGSSAGLENAAVSRAVYSASKFALRGAVHGLREQFRRLPVGFTVISPGALASDVPFDAGIHAALETHARKRIPSGDVIRLVKSLFELSEATTVKEIQMAAAFDRSL